MCFVSRQRVDSSLIVAARIQDHQWELCIFTYVTDVLDVANAVAGTVSYV